MKPFNQPCQVLHQVGMADTVFDAGVLDCVRKSGDNMDVVKCIFTIALHFHSQKPVDRK